MRARTDVPRPVPTPAGDGNYTALPGCLLCGVGTVQALGSEARHVWGDIWHAVPATLGRQGRPEPITGFLCPTCGHEAEAVGALGMTALEHALAAHLGVSRGIFDRYSGEGDWGLGLTFTLGESPLQAWCVLPTGTDPNETPWAHLQGLDELAEGLKALT